MSHSRSGCWQLALVLLVGIHGWTSPTYADEALPAVLLFDGVPSDDVLYSVVEESQHFQSESARSGQQTLLTAALASPLRRPRQPRKFRLDLSPIVAMLTCFLNEHGIPLEEIRDESGRDPVAVSASFAVREDLPAVNFHIGDRAPDPFGAFYASHKGIRWAVVWPVQRLTLRLEGGDDSEFGYLAIAGVQWSHPTRPIAAGFGLPVNMRDAEGNVGVIFQFRAKLLPPR